MSLTSYLTKSEFYTYSGLTISDVDDNTVDLIISNFNNAINKKLSPIFEFNDITKKYYNRIGSQIILIGNFQEAGVVKSISITAGGSGYTTTPTVTISGDGSGAEATATVSGGVVTSIQLTDQGRDYTSATVTITGGGGSGAAATASISTLTIAKGDDDTTTESTLTENTDYRLMPFSQDYNPQEVYPIVAVKLYNYLIGSKGYLKITGTSGYSPYISSEIMLNLNLYEFIKLAVQNSQSQTDTGGKGNITDAKIDKISTRFGDTKYSKLTAGQAIMMGNNYIDNVYKQYTIDSTDLTKVLG